MLSTVVDISIYSFSKHRKPLSGWLLLAYPYSMANAIINCMCQLITATCSLWRKKVKGSLK